MSVLVERVLVKLRHARVSLQNRDLPQPPLLHNKKQQMKVPLNRIHLNSLGFYSQTKTWNRVYLTQNFALN